MLSHTMDGGGPYGNIARVILAPRHAEPGRTVALALIAGVRAQDGFS